LKVFVLVLVIDRTADQAINAPPAPMKTDYDYAHEHEKACDWRIIENRKRQFRTGP